MRPPFVGDSPVAVAYQHVREEAQPPSVYDPEVRPEVDAIVLKALAKERDYRYQSADEMRDDIERFLDGLPVAAAQQAAAYGMGGYGYDQYGYPAQHDPYGQTNLLPQQGPGSAPTTMLSPVGQQGGPGSGYDETAYSPDGYDDGPRGSRRREDPPKKSNASWIILAIAAVFVLVGSFFVASVMFKSNSGGGTSQITVPTLTGKSIADATTAAHTASAKLTLTQGDPIPCGNVAKDLVCQQNPAAGGQMPANGQITVQLSSGPGQSPVPSVTGQPKDAASQALTAAGFTVAPLQYANDDTVPQDSVISQNPTAGTKADPNTPITLTVSSGPGKIAIQSVVGQPAQAAVAALQGQGFTTIDSTSKTQPITDPTSQTLGTVAVQNPSAGTKASKSTPITLTIYTAPAKVNVPILVGKTYKDAFAALSALHLTPSVISGPQDDNAIVVSSNPQSGTPVDPNSTVQLTTMAAPATPSTTPTKGGPTGGGLPSFGFPFSPPGGGNGGN